MMPIEVALCITDLDVGGAERCLQHLAVGMDSERFSPTVYCLGPRPANEEASCVGPIEAAGIPVHCLGAQRAWQLPGTVRKLAKLLTAQSPRIFQSFLFHANFVGRLAAGRAGVPHVLSGIRVAERHCRWHLWLDRWTEHRVERHVCVSRSVADFSVRHAGLPEAKMVVIPNGVDPDVIAAVKPIDLAKLGITPGRRTITFVGRLEPQKGLPWLLDTAADWMPRLSDCDLLLVGEGSQRAMLTAQAQRLGIADRVHLAGWRADVPEILAASDLLVLPSRWEGMPNVVLQAMALGLPVLATDVEGSRELLGSEANPQTVLYGESQVLSEKLLAMMSDRQESGRLGRENRRRALTEFSLAKMVRAYEDLWSRLGQS